VTDYEIVKAPDTDSLSLLVEYFIEQGYSLSGGITIDHSDMGKVYMQVVFKLPQITSELDTDDWKKHSF
jgi:hypothetical protein